MRPGHHSLERPLSFRERYPVSLEPHVDGLVNETGSELRPGEHSPVVVFTSFCSPELERCYDLALAEHRLGQSPCFSCISVN